MRFKFAWCILLIFLLACQQKQTAVTEQTAIPVRTVTLKFENMRVPVHATGILKQGKERLLAFKTGGIIRHVAVKEGQKVKQGDLLAELDLQEVNARLRQAQVQFEKAQKDWQRIQSLFADSVATPDQQEKIKTALEMARANLQIAQFNLQHSRILAPWPGTVLKIFKREQEMVAPGQPVIGFGSSEQGWQIVCGLSDTQVARVQVGDSANIVIDLFPQRTFKGVVSEVAGALDPQSATFETRLVLLEKDAAFRSGFTAQVAIFPAKAEHLALLPYASIVQGKGRKAFVFVVNGQGRVQKIPITIRYFLDQQVAVSGALPENQPIVSQGAAYLTEGARVQVVQ